MNIWTRSGISVGLAAMFYILVSETLKDKLFYEVHKWRFFLGFLVAGILLLPLGTVLNRRMRARYVATQQALPEAERDSDPAHGEPFMLFNLAYWGIMFLIFSAIIVVIVPTPRVVEKPKPVAQVAARTNKPVPAPREPEPPPQPKPPVFKVQGVTIRDATRSALINGRTYFVGDFIGEAKVVEIEISHAVIEWYGAKFAVPAPK